MDEIPTAENVRGIIARKHQLGTKLVTGHKLQYFHEAMIEFAKLHVEAALKEASQKVKLADGWQMCNIDKNSILTAYPLEKIK